MCTIVYVHVHMKYPHTHTVRCYVLLTLIAAVLPLGTPASQGYFLHVTSL
jgi:hypothetical protein